MMDRMDIVIFGATGFTGRKAVEHLGIIGKSRQLIWAVAGRSETKLKDVLKIAGNRIGEDLSNIKIIIADVEDAESIKKMTEQTRVVANCCGPYRFYGEVVVSACIDTKTHYVDVSGEPQFLETIQLKYDDAARQNGVLVIGSCGFDSIPNDVGVGFLDQRFDGTLNAVESYMSVSAPAEAAFTSSIHYGTWASLVHSLAHWSELSKLRKQLYPTKLPEVKPKLKSRGIHFKDGKLCVPFPGADSAVVYRTQRHLYAKHNKRPVQFKPYFEMPNLFVGAIVLFGSVLLFLMTKWSFTRKLLLNFPRLFSLGAVSHTGPSEEVMNNTKFSLKLFGYGWTTDVDNLVDTMPNKTVVAQVQGVNPGYGATVLYLLYSALTILDERNKIPVAGGVITPGIAFRNTSLLEKLIKNNLKFEIVSTDFN